MHGLVAARLGDTEMALRFLRQTSAIDLAETLVNADGGIHIAALGGIWMLAVFGLAGLSLHDQGIAINPHLPADWDSMAFRIQWRGRSLQIRVDQRKRTIDATLETGEPMALIVGNEANQLSTAASVSIPMKGQTSQCHPLGLR
jgi:trehalose/maltose hydrolase-like predicted phosphorylase